MTPGMFVNPATAPPLVLPEPWCELPDGRRGWYQPGWNGCTEACIATVLQVPLIHVPVPVPDDQREAYWNDLDFDCSRVTNPAIDEWWRAVARLADRVGMRLVIHDELPVDRQIWIGLEKASEFDGVGHAVVMTYDQLLHHPASGFDWPPGVELAPLGPIEKGITFDSLWSKP